MWPPQTNGLASKATLPLLEPVAMSSYLTSAPCLPHSREVTVKLPAWHWEVLRAAPGLLQVLRAPALGVLLTGIFTLLFRPHGKLHPLLALSGSYLLLASVVGSPCPDSKSSLFLKADLRNPNAFPNLPKGSRLTLLDLPQPFDEVLHVILIMFCWAMQPLSLLGCGHFFFLFVHLCPYPHFFPIAAWSFSEIKD